VEQNRTGYSPSRHFSFGEILTSVVESFLDSEKIERSIAAVVRYGNCVTRADELGAPPPKNALPALIRDRLGLEICNSGISDSQLMLGNTPSPLVEPPASSAPVLPNRI
jgi:hypothetical protein